jgi:hypothetical protein
MNRLAMNAARITVLELCAFFIGRIPIIQSNCFCGMPILFPKEFPVNAAAAMGRFVSKKVL